ncbi:uncharacterized protein RCH25_050390 [Pelodytes ibericus]
MIQCKKERMNLPDEVSRFAVDPAPDHTVNLELLQHRAVYKAYRKSVQHTEEPEVLKVLELLHSLQGDNGSLLCLVQEILDLDSFQSPSLKALRKRLANEFSKGKISKSTLEKTIGFLSSLLADSFGKFWSEISGQLKDCRVEEIGKEGWARLEPVLKVIATKIVLKRLHGRKNNSYIPAKTQPSVDDKATFTHAVHVAAQGWPTPEVLHFLRHLQMVGAQEGLPLLENNLLCYLEMKKYRNIHHAMPDRGLLRRKVRVIKERFLLPFAPIPQLFADILQESLKAAEAADQSEAPASTIFTHLQESLSDSLLPFWAGFRKAWQIRSPTSAQRIPQLRVQQKLRERLANFELEESPLKTFHLPPVRPAESRSPSMITFSFSISQGVTIKENSAQGRDSQTPPDSRRILHGEELPPLSRLSQPAMTDG